MNSAMPPLNLNSAVLGIAGLGVGGALVGEGDDQSLVEEGELAQTVGQGVVVVLGDGEDGPVRNEVDLGAAPLGGAGFGELGGGNAFGILLLPDGAVAADLELEELGEGVDAADTDAMQAAGNLVGRAVELAAGVQHGHDDLRGGQALAIHIHLIDGNAAAIVDDGDGVVEMHDDIDGGGVSGESFIDRVVHDLVDEMVQAHFAGGADVHGGTLSHGFHAAENLDGIGGVAGFGGGGGLLVEFLHRWHGFFSGFGSGWLSGHSKVSKIVGAEAEQRASSRAGGNRENENKAPAEGFLSA